MKLVLLSRIGRKLFRLITQENLHTCYSVSIPSTDSLKPWKLVLMGDLRTLLKSNYKISSI